MIEHILTPQEYPANPRLLEFEDDDWKYWLDSEKAVYVNWRFKSKPRARKSDRKTTYEWKFHYECDHAGKPHERRDPNLSPSKRRKTSNSIKVGCQAKINIFQLVGSDKVIVEHFWKHNGHDPETLQNTGRVPLFL